MSKHRRRANKFAPYLTTGLALEAVALLAFAHATNGQVMAIDLAATSIFIDGTKSVIGNDEDDAPDRMKDSFGGYFTDESRSFIDYPKALGVLTGLNDPGYDDSEAVATSTTVQAIKDAQQQNPGQPVYVVGYSQGAGAASKARDALASDPTYTFDPDDVTFVFASNPRRNDGGILARLPRGVYVPLLGVSFGDGTGPQGAKVLQVTKQYDGVSDSPDYVFNVVADANAILGFSYLHPGNYANVDPAEFDGIAPDNSDVIIRSNSSGTVTDVMIKAPDGELPLTMPLLSLGIPPSVVAALDPVLRAVIETGYQREDVYPDQPVPFRLVPPPSNWLADTESIAEGAVESAGRFTALPRQLITAGPNASSRRPQSPAENEAENEASARKGLTQSPPPAEANDRGLERNAEPPADSLRVPEIESPRNSPRLWNAATHAPRTLPALFGKRISRPISHPDASSTDTPTVGTKAGDPSRTTEGGAGATP